MQINGAKFIKSAAGRDGFYTDERYQFAVAGKSNVGKSSFINMLANQKKLAKTSNTPGRTRLVNYFDFGSFILTDLPGYGYAKVSRSEQGKWAGMIDDYLNNEPKLIRVIMLVDIRHDPTMLDIQLSEYLYSQMIPFNIVATKLDKISRSAIKPKINAISAALKVGIANILPTSAQDGRGREEVLQMFQGIIDEASARENETISGTADGEVGTDLITE